MSHTIFHRNPDGKIIQLVETPYDSEDLFQRLLVEAQELIPGELIDPTSPRRWLLIAREVSVPDAEGTGGRWSLDHLFLDQDGIPTFVEVKRSADTRLRREVVGQMLDYAANATVYWPVEFIREQFESWCDSEGQDVSQILSSFSTIESDEERFWQDVHTNLIAGRIRLLFVADSIPAELQRIIEFLNERMDPTEVLGVQIKQYVGGGAQTFIPSIVGQTAQAQVVKRTSSRDAIQWDEETFFTVLAERNSSEGVRVARELLNWARTRDLRVWWGKGARNGSFFPLVDANETLWTFAVWTYGSVEIQFQHMLGREFFDSEDMRRELLQRLNAIEDVDIPDDSIERRPSIPLAVLAIGDRLNEFIAVWDWYVDNCRDA